MERNKQTKVKISVSINRKLIQLLDEKTSNRSNYLDWSLLEYLQKLGVDVSKIKL